MKRLSSQTKLLGIILPIFTAITLYVLMAAGTLPQVGALPDLITYVLELAPRTLYAVAVGGVTAFSMHATGMNIPNSQRRELLARAGKDYDGAALRVLLLESACWFGWALVWLAVFRPWS